MKRYLTIAGILLIGTITLPAQDISQKAIEFLNSVASLKTQTQYSLDDTERFNWAFVPLARKGPTFHDFNDQQKTAALELLRASLSVSGYQKASAIMSNENTLREIEGLEVGSTYRDPLNYHFTIFGTPSKDKAWGWRFEGHHVSINFAFNKNELVSSTPSFFGANPGIVQRGAEKGREILKLETDLGYSLVQSLNEDQLKAARFSTTALPEIVSSNNRKATSLSPEGIRFTALNENQKKIFNQLLEVFVKNYEFGFSKKLMEKIQKAGIDNLSFAWAGSLTPGEGHYYRIQGPMLLIEYDNTQTNANHVHTAVRDLTNDFAEDILREHYRKEH
jgi:Protein of unknown function (DUF3500)